MGDRCVCGICGSEGQATGIIEELKLAGFRNDDISALLPDKTGTRDFGYRRASKAPEAASVLALLGCLVGAASGYFLSLGYVTIPELRPLVTIGPGFSALSVAAVFGFTSGIMGALAGMAFPKFEVTRFQGKIRQGNIVLSVHCADGQSARAAKRLFRHNGARYVGSLPERRPARSVTQHPLSRHDS